MTLAATMQPCLEAFASVVLTFLGIRLQLICSASPHCDLRIATSGRGGGKGERKIMEFLGD